MSVQRLTQKFHLHRDRKPIYVCSIEICLGKLIGLADDHNLYMLAFNDGKFVEKQVQQICKELDCGLCEGQNKILQNVEEQLVRYFDGNLKKFSVAIHGIGTEFHKGQRAAPTLTL